jgi:hypothetical protein
MVAKNEQPLPDDAFNQENAEKNKANLNGVVEELRGFLAGLNEPKAAPDAFDPTPPPPAPSQPDFPSEPFMSEPFIDAPPVPEPIPLPSVNNEPPSFADSMFLQEPAPPAAPPAPSPLSITPEPPEIFSAPDPSTVAPNPFTPPMSSPSPTVDEFQVPIPGTLNNEAPTESPIFATEPVIADDMGAGDVSLKPEGVVQIACIYPEGKEKQSQQFVAKLKEFATKSKKTTTIHPVFIQAWNRDTINMTAWGKSAHLSGADLIFILSPKNDAALFDEALRNSRVEGVPVRLLYLENVALRTLYADVLVDCQRSVNVKGRS